MRVENHAQDFSRERIADRAVFPPKQWPEARKHEPAETHRRTDDLGVVHLHSGRADGGSHLWTPLGKHPARCPVCPWRGLWEGSPDRLHGEQPRGLTLYRLKIRRKDIPSPTGGAAQALSPDPFAAVQVLLLLLAALEAEDCTPAAE